jgi:hypothetical protein
MTRDERAYREAHREEIMARQLVWEERHREARNAQKRHYYALHREQIAVRRAVQRNQTKEP